VRRGVAGLGVALALCGAGAGSGDDLAARLEGALLEDEEHRLETCEQALPDQRRLWPVCVLKLELEFEIMAGCFRHVNRLEAGLGAPSDPPPSLAERDRRIEECRQSSWQRLLRVEPGWLAPSPPAH
jgi:hypothetical protein